MGSAERRTGQVDGRGHHLPNVGRVLEASERSGTDRAGYYDWNGLLGPPTVAVRRPAPGGMPHAAVLV